MTSPWVFTQLAGSKETVTLQGYAAPFGRPRIKPVVTTGKQLRQSSKRYPGNSGAPTRHLFGTNQKDIELNGRWMDKHLGDLGALSLKRQLDAIIDEQQRVSVSWGDFLSYTGIIESLDVGWESQTECTWVMKVLVDVDDFDGQVFIPTPSTSPRGFYDDVLEFVSNGFPSISHRLSNLDALTGELFDLLDDAISSVNSVSALLVHTLSTIESFESATFAELQRLRAGVHQFKTAVLIMQGTIESITIDTMLLDRQAEDDIAWLTFQMQAMAQTVHLLGRMAALSLAAEEAERGKFLREYTAKTDDSWESISIAVYGDANGADRIRKANGIKYGDAPLAGMIYQIPD